MSPMPSPSAFGWTQTSAFHLRQEVLRPLSYEGLTLAFRFRRTWATSLASKLESGGQGTSHELRGT
jgi:hypothetical protein